MIQGCHKHAKVIKTKTVKKWLNSYFTRLYAMSTKIKSRTDNGKKVMEFGNEDFVAALRWLGSTQLVLRMKIKENWGSSHNSLFANLIS